MFRVLLYALISIFAITFIRMVVGILTKGFADLLREESGSGRAGQSRPSQQVPTSGELKPCRQCGTYVVAGAAIQASVKGETVYFCSEECRKKAGV